MHTIHYNIIEEVCFAHIPFRLQPVALAELRTIVYIKTAESMEMAKKTNVARHTSSSFQQPVLSGDQNEKDESQSVCSVILCIYILTLIGSL